MNADLNLIFKSFISSLPDHSVPDEENYLSDGRQYKAPDHSVFNGKYLIERKTINTHDNGQFYRKFLDISHEQNKEIFAVGKVPLSNMIELLPDKESANSILINYSTNQLRKTIRSAAKKFEEYGQNIDISKSLKFLVITDSTDLSFSTEYIEYVIGNFYFDKNNRDKIRIIDCIIYIKHPLNVLRWKNSHWYKSIIPEYVGPCLIKEIQTFSELIYSAMSSDKEIQHFIDLYKLNKMRHMIVDDV